MRKFSQQKRFKKALCVVLSIVLIFGMVPISDTFAEELQDSANTKVQTDESALTDDNANIETTNDATDEKSDEERDESEKTEESSDETNTSDKDEATQDSDSIDGDEAQDKGSDNSEDEEAADIDKSNDEETKDAEEAEKSEKIKEKIEDTASSMLEEVALIPTDNMYEGSVRVGTDKYFATIDDAIEYLNSNGGGTIEVFKDVTLSSSHTITAAITIKNIVSGITSNILNPTKNGNSHAQPVVTINPSANVIIDGGTLDFVGAVLDGGGVARTTTIEVEAGTVAKKHACASPFVVKSGTVNISNGVAGDDGTGIEATETSFSNFITNAGYGGGVFYIAGGTVNVSAGDFSGNRAGQYGGGVFKLHEAGSLNITSDDAKFSGNYANGGGGVIYTHATDTSNTTTVSISGGIFEQNTATGSGGGVVFINNTGNTTTISGGTFTQNSCDAGGYGSAIDLNYGTLIFEGDPEITKNNNATYGAVYIGGDAGSTATRCFVSGNPRIVNNGNPTNLYVKLAVNLIVNGSLGENARIGITGLNGKGTDFASTSGDTDTTKYIACFSNDVNSTLIPAAGSLNRRIKWSEAKDADGNDYVCYITHEGITTYYISLQAAIAAAAEGDTIEIFKNNTFNTESSINVSGVTIKNVDNPLNTGVDWSLNGNAKVADDSYGNTNGQPITTVGTSGKITYGASATNSELEGVIFSGEDSERANHFIFISNGAVVAFNDGASGKTNIAGDELKTNSLFTKFNNATGTTDDTTGGVMLVQGQVTINGSVTFSYNNCNGVIYIQTIGGHVAHIDSTGSITFDGGVVDHNGEKYCDSSTHFYGASVINNNGGNFDVENTTVTNNYGVCGAFCNFSATTATGSTTGGYFYKNNASHQGGVFYLTNDNTTYTVSGNAVFEENTAGNSGSAIELRYGNNNILQINGNVKIINNHSTGASRDWCGGAISSFNAQATASGVVQFLGGAPIIYGNTDKDNLPADMVFRATNQVIVKGSLDKGAKIGYYSPTQALVTKGNQFATSSAATASSQANVAGAFINNKDSSLVSSPSTTSNAINWSIAVVKETTGNTGTGTFVAYYESLNKALDSVADGNTLEILKEHTLDADGSLAAGKTCYIRNIVSPANETENPFIDEDGNIIYSEDQEPVVYFSKNVSGTITDYRLTISGIANVEGVKFSGCSWTGTATDDPAPRDRTSSGILVNGTLNINNGSDGTLPDSTTETPNVRTACATVAENFINTTCTSLNSGGGFLNVVGKVVMDNGTIKNCQSYANAWNGGGACAAICGANAEFTLNGGLITQNGRSNHTGGYSENSFYVGYGTFNMTGGTVTNNAASTGGCVSCTSDGMTTAAQVAYVNISGGTITNNTLSLDGGAVFAGQHTVCTISTESGALTIANNTCARSAGAIEIRQGSTLTISGSPRIVDNKVTGNYAYGGGISAYTATKGTVTISDNPVIYGNTNNNGAQKSDLNLNDASKLIVGASGMGKSAMVGYNSQNASLLASGAQFATTTAASASSAGNLNGFINNVNTDATTKLPYRGTAGDGTKVVWSSFTPTVKVTETVTKNTYNADGTISGTTYTDVVHTFGGTTAIADAFACVAAMPEGNVVAGKKSDNVTDKDYIGSFPIECLVADISQTASCTVSAGAKKPIVFTTAKTNAEDGYSYQGTAGTNAVVKRGANFGSMFYLNSSSKITVMNLTMDGAGGTYASTDGGGFFKNSGAELILDNGSILQNSVMTAKTWNNNNNWIPGAAIFCNSTTAKVVMQGDAKITKCKARATIYIDYGSMEMGGISSITECVSLSQGGAINLWGVKLTMKDNAKITGCESPEQSAISCDNSTVYLQDNVEITGNTTYNVSEANYAHAAISTYSGGTVHLSGSVKIYGNTDSNNVAANLHERTAVDNATYIYVEEAGFTSNAKIYVYSDNNGSAGRTFARTVAEKSASSTNAVNLSRFYNDKDTSLNGTAGSGNAVVWSKYIPVCITIKQDPTPEDKWYTLQIQSATTGSRMRVPVKVAANASSGSIVTMQPAGVKGFVSCIADGSAYGYTLSDPKYVNTPDTTNGGTELGSDTDQLEGATSFLCAMTVNSTNSYKGNIKTDSGVRELTFTSTWSNPDSTTKLTDMMEVTNTIKSS